MKKNRCYPKYSYILGFVLAGILLIFALGPIFIETDDELYIKIIWSTAMFFFAITMCFCALWYKQYYVIENDKIIVKSVFGMIVSLELSKCFLIIQRLRTDRYSFNEWLCVYENGNVPLFTRGYSNKSKYKRIQIIDSEENAAILSQYVQPSIKNI